MLKANLFSFTAVTTLLTPSCSLDKKTLMIMAKEEISPMEYDRKREILSLIRVIEESQNNQKSCFFNLAKHNHSWLSGSYLPKSFQTIIAYTVILNQYMHSGVPFLLELFQEKSHLHFDSFKTALLFQLEKSDFDPFLANQMLHSLDKNYLENSISMSKKFDVSFMNEEKEIYFTLNPQEYFSHQITFHTLSSSFK
jgi:hypothetical protein